ncbi:Histone-lysine N-methyltransferase, H3 lysine-79 specific [Podosphaera aphanis]|nr:Histone-lysine N-methyltransferase, H3 lysine-79 specific [Podosphaera aphanis]
MNNLFNKSFGIKAAPKVIRTERLPGPTKSSKRPSQGAESGSHSRRIPGSTISDQQKPARVSSSPIKRDDPTSKKRKVVRQRVPVQRQPPLSSDSSDSENPSDLEKQSSKRRRCSRPEDKKRKLFTEVQTLDFTGSGRKMIQAADLISIGNKATETANDNLEAISVELQYPNVSQPERYTLVFGEDFNPTEEIIVVVRTILDFYVTENYSKDLKDPENGVFRKLTKAYNLLTKDKTNRALLNNFKETVELFNSELDKLKRNETFLKRLRTVHEIPLYVVECILQQVYCRAVSPSVDVLKRYENGTDNIYGELLPPFVSQILGEANLTSENTFVDLGSGVGNVVLQAALEFGCESWGCEMMENACALADAQLTEFKVRCHLWGINAGRIQLLRGDFLDNPEIHAAMRKADVILVNNQAFTPDLNQKLKDLFLDLKNGCRVISLKSFVPHGHQISSRNLWDPANLLAVVEGEYHSRSVSWTDTGGKYYIATKDDKRLNEFANV